MVLMSILFPARIGVMLALSHPNIFLEPCAEPFAVVVMNARIPLLSVLFNNEGDFLDDTEGDLFEEIIEVLSDLRVGAFFTDQTSNDDHGVPVGKFSAATSTNKDQGILDDWSLVLPGCPSVSVGATGSSLLKNLFRAFSPGFSVVPNI